MHDFPSNFGARMLRILCTEVLELASHTESVDFSFLRPADVPLSPDSELDELLQNLTEGFRCLALFDTFGPDFGLRSSVLFEFGRSSLTSRLDVFLEGALAPAFDSAEFFLGSRRP